MPTMQIDKTAIREYLLEELPVIFEENHEIQQSIARIFEQQNLRELVEAQKTSAQQLTRLEIAITELAEAQKRVLSLNCLDGVLQKVIIPMFSKVLA